MLLLLPLARAADPEPCAEEDPTCDTVVVTASRTDAGQAAGAATAPVVVLDRARIEAAGATTLDEVLRGIPGVQVTTSHGGAGLSLQGLDAGQSLVLIDGRPIAGRVEGTVDLSRIPVADVERIEILPGPASALYGSEALGGVINVITRHPDDALRADVGVRVGTRRGGQVEGALSGGGSALRGGFSAHSDAQDGWDADPSDVATTVDDERRLGWRAWGRAAPRTALVIDADGAYDLRDSTGVEATPAGAVFDVRTVEETAGASLGARVLTGATSLVRADVSATLWRQQYLENQRDSDVQDAYSDTLDRRLYGNLAWQAYPRRHVLAVGVDGALEGLRSERLDSGEASRGRMALYGQDDWTLSDRGVRVAVSPGARVDYDGQFGLHATPHLALRVDPLRALSLRLSGGAGYRAPEFKELYLAFNHASYGYELHGNPELAPEQSVGATLDARWRPPGPVQVHAQGWWNEVSNLIEPELVSEGSSSAPAQYTYGNVGRAATRGASAGLAWVRPGPLGAALDYTYTHAWNRTDGVPLDGRAPHQVGGTLDLHPGAGFDLSGTLDWSSARPYTLDGTTSASPATTWVDARVAWAAAPRVEVEAGVHNLLDARDDTYRMLTPRTWYIGVHTTGLPLTTPERP